MFFGLKLQSGDELSANLLLFCIQKQLSFAGHGRLYGSHRASAPGESPAPDTTTLMRSWRVVLAGHYWTVRTDLPYAWFLELGTRKIARRPYLERALKLFASLSDEYSDITGGVAETSIVSSLRNKGMSGLRGEIKGVSNRLTNPTGVKRPIQGL